MSEKKSNKIFDASLNSKYDNAAKDAFEMVMLQQSYTKITKRVDELHDDDSSFWDQSGIDKNGKVIYFGLEVKALWHDANFIPRLILDTGFDFLNRKSIEHNPRNNKVNYLVMFSSDFCAFFMITKEVYEQAKVFKKDTKYTAQEAYRRISIDKGRLYKIQDAMWHRAQVVDGKLVVI